MSGRLSDAELKRLVDEDFERVSVIVLRLLGLRPFDEAEPPTLAEEMVLVLGDGVPRTAPEIAKLVQRRRVDVEQELAGDDRFVRVAAPRGRSRRAQTWTLGFQGWSDSSLLVLTSTGAS